MPKELNIKLSIPNTNDALPHTVIRNGRAQLLYTDSGRLCIKWDGNNNPIVVSQVTAEALGLPTDLPCKVVVADDNE